MKPDCENLAANANLIVDENLPPAELIAHRQHAEGCVECRDLLAGVAALGELRRRESSSPGPALFDRLCAGAQAPGPVPRRFGFWTGTAVGGVFASLVFAFLFIQGNEQAPAEVMATTSPVDFVLDVRQRRMMDIAIDTDRDLHGARITIELNGAIVLDGYGDRREVEWQTDLRAGTNRLSLPIVATDPGEGRLVVRLSHPQSEKVFVVRLKTSA